MGIQSISIHATHADCGPLVGTTYRRRAIFQFTQAVQIAAQLLRLLRRLVYISIHATRADCGLLRTCHQVHWVYFDSHNSCRLRQDGFKESSSSFRFTQLVQMRLCILVEKRIADFNSRNPCRLRLDVDVYRKITLHFDSRNPCRLRRDSRDLLDYLECISIHATRADCGAAYSLIGADPVVFRFTQLVQIAARHVQTLLVGIEFRFTQLVQIAASVALVTQGICMISIHATCADCGSERRQNMLIIFAFLVQKASLQIQHPTFSSKQFRKEYSAILPNGANFFVATELLYVRTAVQSFTTKTFIFLLITVQASSATMPGRMNGEKSGLPLRSPP